jgi:hypothetical protein
MPTYPLTALQNATSIGNPWEGMEVKQGMMPGPPALSALRSILPGINRIRPVMETLGERGAEFTPVGGEALYNLGKGGLNAINKAGSMLERLPDMGWGAFQRFAGK